MRIIHLSDIHLTENGRSIWDTDGKVAADMRKALETITENKEKIKKAIS